jgi:hypothetical protein
LRPVLAVLLELDEVSADEPIAQDEVAVDRPCGSGLGLLVRGCDRGDQGGVIHGRTEDRIEQFGSAALGR